MRALGVQQEGAATGSRDHEAEADMISPDDETYEQVAIKRINIDEFGQLSDTQILEMEKEVDALASVSHKRLVRFVGACLEYPQLSIVTEFMAGGSLHALLHCNTANRDAVSLGFDRSFDWGQRWKVAYQFIEGVAFLHGLKPHPLVHRDLKSLNLVLDLEFNVKLCDFGLTRKMEKTHLSLRDGGNGGSPRYSACFFCLASVFHFRCARVFHFQFCHAFAFISIMQ